MKRHPLLPYLAAVLAILAGCGLMYRPGDPDVEANLFTVQGAVNDAPASTAGEIAAGATAAAPAERIRPQRVVVLGDSTGEFLGRLMANYADFDVDVRALRRCPLRPGEHTGKMYPSDPDGQWQITDQGATYPGESCGWRNYIDKIDFSFADVYLFAGPMMQVDFDDGNILTNGDVMLAEMRSLIRELYARGVSKVIVVSQPASKAAYGQEMFWLQPERVEAWNALLRSAATPVPSEETGACLLDYASWAATQPDPREDGSHMSGEEGQKHAGWMLQTVRDRVYCNQERDS
jgi:hypothetical protein